jgi:PKD repeat protein
MNSIRLISQGRPFYGKGETNILVVNILNKFWRLVYKAKFILLMLFLSGTFSASATHVVGGGITYTKMENDNYLLTVKLYRDCSPGTAQLPGNVNVLCRRGNDGTNPGTFGSHILPLMNVTPLQPQVPACAFNPGICVEEATYQDIVTIPDGPGGYHLYYTICCRNATILNITNPLNARETFYAYIPERGSLTPDFNSSPFFNDIPPMYVCAGQPLNLSFSAMDYDGDSLDYYFYTPYDGNNGGGINVVPGIPPNNINISTVNWAPGFGATDPLDAGAGLIPGLTIDNTGFINGIPPAPGQYVVGVMVDEYRNGVLIGRISRDFQFNVINCPPPLEAIVDVPNQCDGLNADFLNNSTGNFNTQWWDFGTGNPADSSTQFQPSFTYPAPGNYDVTLIVEPGTPCADTVIYNLTIMNPVQFTVDVDSVSCNGLNDGQAMASAIDPLYVYNWSTLQSGNSIINLPPANYWAVATNSIGCVDTQFFLIEEPNILDVQFNETEPLCNGDVNGSLNAVVTGGTAPYNYYWPSTGSTANPLINISAGNYDVEITDDNGCFISNAVSLGEPQQLDAYLIGQGNVSCNDLNNGSAIVGAIGGSPAYSYFWPSLGSTSFAVNNLPAGAYAAEITDLNGCLSTLIVNITQPDTFFVDVVVINDETCTSGNGSAFADITGGVGVISYLWSPSGGISDFDSGLSAGPIQVIVQDENGCTDQATGIIQNFATGVASIGNATPVSCQNGADGSVEIIMTGGTAPFQYNWSCAWIV